MSLAAEIVRLVDVKSRLVDPSRYGVPRNGEVWSGGLAPESIRDELVKSVQDALDKGHDSTYICRLLDQKSRLVDDTYFGLPLGLEFSRIVAGVKQLRGGSIGPKANVAGEILIAAGIITREQWNAAVTLGGEL